MSTIEPGTPVRVIIAGTVEAVNLDENRGMSVITADSYGVWVTGDDPAVQVVPVSPERPTLDREALAEQLWTASVTFSNAGRSPDERWDERPVSASRQKARAQADAILALIDAAHPGLIR